ncbi:MAG: polysaccharide deacetylase [Burkholderiales bacterium]|nr:MAG: polysaccharide deacetylase [Burkholderiales bacterium]
MLAWPILHTLSKDKLSVFLFHKVPKVPDPLVPNDFDLASFESMLDRICKNFRVLPVGDAVDCLRKGSIPRRTACITFDDGYPDWQYGVLPALRRRNMHATFYITTGQFDRRPLWHERILAAVRGLPDGVFDLGYAPLQPILLQSLQDRQRLVHRLELELKYLTLHKREELMQRLESLAGVSPASVPVMSPDALRDLHSQGFGVGAHTIDHPILDYCDETQTNHEIGGVKEQLEAMVAGRVEGFAYPNGRPYADFSRLHVDAVKKAGYTHAVTTHWGVAKPETSVFQIPRFTPWAKREWHALYQVGRNLLTDPMLVPENSL